MFLNPKALAVMMWAVSSFTMFTCTCGEGFLENEEWPPYVENESVPKNGVKENAARFRAFSAPIQAPRIQPLRDNEPTVPHFHQENPQFSTADSAEPVVIKGKHAILKEKMCRLTPTVEESLVFKLFGLRNHLHLKYVILFIGIAVGSLAITSVILIIIVRLFGDMITGFWEALMQCNAWERFVLIGRIFGPSLLLLLAVSIVARYVCE